MKLFSNSSFSKIISTSSLFLWVLPLFFCVNPNFLFSQKNINPTFDTFKGTAYQIPYKERYHLKYHPKYQKYPIITEFEWDEINIPETNDSILFPSVNKKSGFALILKSNMHITKKGWYKLSLDSDDGSLLWVDKKLVIQNDGTHQMKLQEDSVALDIGTYPIKIWYYQGFPDRYGFIFKSSYYREMENKEAITALRRKNSLEEKSIKLSISNQVLNFDHDSYRLDKKANEFLDDFCNKTFTKISVEDILMIKISGHTDNSGSTDYNAQLSLQRAQSLSNELKKRILSDKIKYVLQGLGESQPILSNDTSDGRIKNRRVEVEIILKEK